MSIYVLWGIDGALIYNRRSAGGIYLDAIEFATGIRPTVPPENPHGVTTGAYSRDELAHTSARVVIDSLETKPRRISRGDRSSIAQSIGPASARR